jgi:hypothetical protein
VLTEFSIRAACECINAGARREKNDAAPGKTKPGRRQNIQNIPYAVLICVRRVVCWFASISPLIQANEQQEDEKPDELRGREEKMSAFKWTSRWSECALLEKVAGVS